MRVALVQHDIVWEDGAATRTRLEPLIAQAVAAGARLVVLSEMFATGFSMAPEVAAENRGGDNEQWLVSQASRHGIWLIGSIAQWPGGSASTDPPNDGAPNEDAPSVKAMNVAVLAGPDGQRFRYAKIHPFSYGGEHEHYIGGDEFLTVTVEGLRVSVFICYDLRFADEFWQRALDTDLYVVPANWPESRRDHWRTLLRARAIENLAYVAGCNRVGTGGKNSYSGDSTIIDPRGRTLTEASRIETVLIADVDPAEVMATRERFGFLVDRR